MTNLFEAKITGRVGWEAKDMSTAKKGKGGKGHHFERKEGGMADKKAFMVKLIQEGKGKDAVVKAAMKQYPEMKESYAKPLYYHATKAAKVAAAKG